MKTYADKDHKHRNQPIAHQATQRKSDNNTEGATQTKLQQMANNSPQVKQLRALQQMANDSPQTKAATQLQAIADDHSQQTIGKQVVQRAVLIPGHIYEPGKTEPEIRTSVNFDTNHLVVGAATNDIATTRKINRGTAKNTIVSQAALKREVESDDLSLTRRVNTGQLTRYGNLAPAEAKLASVGGVLPVDNIDIMSRSVPAPIGQPRIVEIHHLHDAEQHVDMNDFPALGAEED